jgi:hypothetical protein
MFLDYKLKRKFNNADHILAIIGLAFGIIITSLYLVSPTIYLFSIGMTLILSCSLYLFAYHIYEYPFQELSRKEKTILDVIFLVLFSLSLIILHNSEHRPASYFLIYSLCVATIAVSIYFSTQRQDYLKQAIKIILVSLNIKYSIYNLAGVVPGIDSWTHAGMNQLLSQYGTIDVLRGKEMYFPIMHMQTAIMEIIGNNSIKDASNFAVIIPFVLASIFVYLISKQFIGERGGLFAMLLISISDYNIYWGSAPQTTTYGLIFYYMLIYLLIKTYYIKSSPEYVTLSIFLSFVLVLTHAVSSFIFTVTILSLFAGSIVYSYLYEEKIISQFRSISVISLITLLQYWFIALYKKEGDSFFKTIASTLHNYVTGSAGLLNRPETTDVIAKTLPPFLERLADTTGFSILLFFGVVGALLCSSSKYRNKINFIFIYALTIIFGIMFAFPLFGLRNIMPTRWFSFGYLFLSMFASFAILKLFSCVENKKNRSIWIFLVFVSISFFMSTSTVSNLDSPVWLKNSTVSTTYSLKEVTGTERIVSYGANIVTDSSYGHGLISAYLDHKYTVFNVSNRLNGDSTFLWRSYMEDRPIPGSVIKVKNKILYPDVILGSAFHSDLDKKNKIYDNNGLSAYL